MRPTIAVLAAAALLVPTAQLTVAATPRAEAAAARGLPKLGQSEARGYFRSAFRREIGRDFWDYAYSRRTDCTHRVSRTMIRCRPFIGAGDTFYTGRARIWLKRDRNGDVFWHYAWRLREVSEYCLLVLERPKRKCIELHVVK